MREAIEEVLELQALYDHRKTDAMDRRRELLSKVIAEEVREALDSSTEMSSLGWSVEGSNGKGFNAAVPWVRIFDREKSPSATTGAYVVYLFGGKGASAYLTLMSGTSEWSESRKKFVARPPEEIAAKVKWARETLASEATSDLLTSITLDSKKLQPVGYERGAVYAIEYEHGLVPGDGVLRQDIARMSQLLRRLYAADGTPGALVEAPEVSDAMVAAAQSAGNTRKTQGRGQGFALSQDAKVAIELQAVAIATEHFENLGYVVSDVGATESFDLLAAQDDTTVSVEVKGTTSLGQEVILTRNEVLHHQQVYPDNALAIVHSIVLDRTVEPPVASGGVLVVRHPWAIDEVDLTPVSYRYSTGLE
ncbi:MrcB family domain-containing protein [Rhodococcus sp. NPDC003318]|uniref:MrcB family domain-containing protein n=1 Tax=Rhodococcus sp. NPDC003318 TaxID=3364503 RepID=UPI00367FA2F9